MSEAKAGDDEQPGCVKCARGEDCERIVGDDVRDHEPPATGLRGWLAIVLGQRVAYSAGRLDEVRSFDRRWMVLTGGKKRETPAEKAAEFAAAMIHVHHRVYGTWPPAEQVQRALDALDVPNNGPLS